MWKLIRVIGYAIAIYLAFGLVVYVGGSIWYKVSPPVDSGEEIIDWQPVPNKR